MSQTKRESPEADFPSESQAKRPKPDKEHEAFVPLTLDDTNDHCVLEIFTYLSVEELNSDASFKAMNYMKDCRHSFSYEGNKLVAPTTRFEESRWSSSQSPLYAEMVKTTGDYD